MRSSTFNSLFEMHEHQNSTPQTDTIQITFNSLFEMRGGILNTPHGSHVAFNSLFEKPEQQGAARRRRCGAFNSLFEMLGLGGHDPGTARKFTFNSLFEMPLCRICHRWRHGLTFQFSI